MVERAVCPYDGGNVAPVVEGVRSVSSFVWGMTDVLRGMPWLT
jgi:hypothetical protein